MGLAASASIRQYLAERGMETVRREDLERAVRLEPDNSEAWARLGAVLEREGETERAVRALEQAVQRNPYNAPAWVDLALHFEVEGDAARAERCLLEALRADRGGATYWALANFYLRQGADPRFWSALRETLSRTRGNLEEAFELAWRASGDPAEILQKAVPDDPAILRRYFDFLLRSGRQPALAAVWERIAPRLEPADSNAALHYVDQLLERAETKASVAAWNALCRRGLLPYAPLDAARGPVLTNPDFRHAPLGRGFDWKLQASDQIQVETGRATAEAGLRVSFSGGHPEAADLVWQPMPVEPGRTYRFAFRYRTGGLAADTGLHWKVADPLGGASAELAAVGPLPARGAWTEQAASFRAGAATRLVRLAFSYRRSFGTTRDRGWVEIADLSVSPLPEAPR